MQPTVTPKPRTTTRQQDRAQPAGKAAAQTAPGEAGHSHDGDRSPRDGPEHAVGDYGHGVDDDRKDLFQAVQPLQAVRDRQPEHRQEHDAEPRPEVGAVDRCKQDRDVERPSERCSLDGACRFASERVASG